MERPQVGGGSLGRAGESQRPCRSRTGMQTLTGNWGPGLPYSPPKAWPSRERGQALACSGARPCVI